MKSGERFLVTSHGFATDPDSGGLFSSITNRLPHSIINYNHYEKYQRGNRGDVYIPSLDEQTENLREFVERFDAPVTLMGHSRGTTAVARLALMEQVSDVILLAPPHEAGSDTIVQMVRERGGGDGPNGELVLHRTNGISKIYISPDYFPNMEAFDHMGTYRQVADAKPTTIVTGKYDKVVDQKVIQTIENAMHVSIDAGHNLQGDDRRRQLASILRVLHS